MEATDKARNRAGRIFVVGLVLIWLLVVGAGMAMLTRYDNTPGLSGQPPKQWPEESGLPRPDGTSTLVMFGHPRCPCTRASLEELAPALPLPQ